jgi:hypothetical protein
MGLTALLYCNIHVINNDKELLLLKARQCSKSEDKLQEIVFKPKQNYRRMQCVIPSEDPDNIICGY